MLPTQLKPGTVFGQDYEILERLAQGGMGTVYVALQQSTGKRRALKVMHAQYEGDETARRRFIQEARAGAAIDSDHIVEMVGAGIDADTNTPWIAMELLKGKDLKSVMSERGRLPPAEVQEIFRQICHALGRAHKMGLVHRDLKPENIFLAAPRREGIAFTVKILDFGIAKLLRDTTGNSTQTQAIGSPRWMSPEQADRGGPIAASTDVWALGLIAFYLLTGEVYWKTAHVESPSVIGQMCEILMDPIAPASERATDFGVGHLLPAHFDGWFARCVHRDQSARFADADEALAALEEVFGDLEPLPLAPRRSATPPRGVSIRPPAAPQNTPPQGVYRLEVPSAHSRPEQPFALDATAVAEPATAPSHSDPPAADTTERPWTRRVGPVLLAVLGPVGIAVAVLLGLRHEPVTTPAPLDAATVVAPDAPSQHAAAPDVSAPDASASADVAAAPDVTIAPDVAALVAHDVVAVRDVTVAHDVVDAARVDARAVRPGRPDAAEGEPDAAPTADGDTAAYTSRVLHQLRGNYPTFVRCYEQNATPNADTRVNIHLHFTIRADGSPAAVGVNGSSDAVNGCIADAIRGLSFPTPVVVTSPIFHELHFEAQ